MTILSDRNGKYNGKADFRIKIFYLFLINTVFIILINRNYKICNYLKINNLNDKNTFTYVVIHIYYMLLAD